MRFYLNTLGCKINQYESQVLREAWQRCGHVETEDPGLAEVLCINSCAVTERAVQDVRRAARRLRSWSPGATLIVTGCAAGLLSDEAETLPAETRLVPQGEKAFLGERLEYALADGRIADGPELPEQPGPGITWYPRARPVLKVQDGCSRGCTYCIVPLTRGPARSRAPQDILAEARQLADQGYPELVVSGINLAQYTRADHGLADFWDLVQWLDRELSRDPGQAVRLRLSSLDPAQLRDKALKVLAGSRLICPHLHISLQSGSQRILERMGRGRSNPDRLAGFLEGLGSVWPVFGLGADMLLGFPGEEPEDFRQSYRIVSELPFSYAHVFTYSSRPGTAAACLPDPVEPAIRKERSRELRSLVSRKREQFMARVLQEVQQLQVVLEGGEPAHGLCEHYVQCSFEPDPHQSGNGTLASARPVGRTARGGLLVEPVQTL
jgi:MiaB/RimO family radical SAM methylthiotransferase